MDPRPLTPKQQRFIDEYLVDLNATAAAERAGYSPRTARVIGPENLSKPASAAAIQAAQQTRAQRAGLSQDYVLDNLQEIVERCMQRAPVVNMKGEQIQDEEGNHLWTFNAKAAIQALALLGKHQGMFAQKILHGGDPDNPIRYEATEDQRKAAMERLHAAVLRRMGSSHANDN